MNKALELKAIVQFLGEHFYIPYYQRGYRWTSQQVNDLLNDIWAFTTTQREKGEFYCLQPIVVKRKIWNEEMDEIDGWEVIDGQQRLTTLYIIINYLAKEFLKVDTLIDDYGKESYSIRYETRPKSAQFLKTIPIPYDKSNIDYYHIYNAYETVKKWFTNGENTKDRTDKNKFLNTLLGKKDDERSVQVIWYSVEAKEEKREIELKKSIELFTRLNIGKIPLTNAELIKALFLSSSSFGKESYSPDDAIRMKMEISQMWDDIELKLNDEHFWSFITNAKKDEYSTKIELLFDVISKKQKNEIDPLFTFLYFLKKSKDPSKDSSKLLWDIWVSIEQYYLTLCEWYKDKNLYHKIGFLVASNENHLRELIELSMNEKKDNFELELNKKIRKIVNYEIDTLDYEHDYKKIEKVLLLFNVESIRKNDSITEFYPFKFHKNIHWSIEHIHAQNSQSMDSNKKEPWFKWLNYHEKLITELAEDSSGSEKNKEWSVILEDIKQFNNEKLTWGKFNQLSTMIIDKFSERSDNQSNDLHSISNLALLSQPDNAALNNSVFEVKRRDIIEMDKKGNYIPICTRRVFLKYYNDKSSTQQYYFWGKEDRDNYLNEIKIVLEDYLPQSTT